MTRRTLQQLFDFTVLEDLVDGDRAMFKKFTLMCISSFETALANIDGALKSADLVALCAMGHRAKTTARNIGAIALGNACEALETISLKSNIEEATQAVVGLHLSGRVNTIQVWHLDIHQDKVITIHFDQGLMRT